MNKSLAAYYESEFGKKLAEPESKEDVENILNCISIRNGFLSNKAEAELQGRSDEFSRMVQLLADAAREDRAQFTKAYASSAETILEID